MHAEALPESLSMLVSAPLTSSTARSRPQAAEPVDDGGDDEFCGTGVPVCTAANAVACKSSVVPGLTRGRPSVLGAPSEDIMPGAG
eukprot:1349039-Pleurochrysis_carterae.AAC.1